MTIQEQLTTTVSTKGQIVLPSYIRQSRHWDAGTRLVVENTPEGVLLKPASILKETNIKDVFGILKWSGKPKTLEEMDEAILEGMKRNYEGD